ncbi:MAG: hypothetical protein QOF35_1585 [Actinomycetota bacterium]|nr:hypothetical protein [Actinomycetota bacterium]
MMRWIVGSAVHFGRLVIALAVAMMIFGVIQLRDAPIDTYPQFTAPSVQIQTEALGLSAAEVEALITVPLEQDLLNGIPWVDTITSQSITGLSSVDIVFEPGTDLLRARQMTQERLNLAAALPNFGTSPVMIQPLSSMGRVMMISLSSKALSPLDLSVLARWQVRPKLMGVPGVANVAIWGQRDRQLQVLVDPNRLAKNGVTLNQVISTTGNALWVSPLTFVQASTPGTGGFVDTPNQRFGVQHIFPITTAPQLSSVAIQDTGGRRLRLADVANVVESHQPLIGDASVGGTDSLVLVVQKFPGTNTLEVTKAVEDAIASLRPGLSDVKINTQVFRPASYIESALRNVALGAGIALLLTILLLGLLFTSWRVALIGAVTIPLSAIAAGYVLYLGGATFSPLVLAGLFAALGVVIHDTVVGVDAVLQGMRGPSDAPGSQAGEAPHRAGAHVTDAEDSRASKVRLVVDATAQAWAPLTYATIALVLLVIPALLLTGTAEQFARSLVGTYLLAVMASLVVSLTVTPAMALWLLANEHRVPSPQGASRAHRALASLRRRSAAAAAAFVTRPRRAFGLLGVMVVAGLVAAPVLTSSPLLPGLQDRDLLIKVQTMPGTSLTETNRVTAAASTRLRALNGVDAVGVHTGRAVTSDQVVNVNSGEIWVKVDGSADVAATSAAVRGVMDEYPGVSHTLSTYAGDRLSAAESGPTQPVVVRVYGQDFQELSAQAEKVRRTLSSVKGIRNARSEPIAEEPSLQVQVDLAKAQHYGVRPGDVRRAAATLLSGLPVGSLYEQQKIFDVVVWGNETTRRSVADVQNLAIDTSTGRVPLRDLATVRLAPFPAVVKHQDISRSLDVTADVSGRDLGAVKDEVASRIRAMTFPLEYRAEVAPGSGDSSQPSRATLAYLFAALLAIMLIFQAATSSWRLGALLLLTLPLAGVGGLVAAALASRAGSLGALLGLLAVLGLAIRSNLSLVRRLQNLRAGDISDDISDDARHDRGDDRDLVLQATREQTRPVLLTALTTAAALAPFAVLGSIAGLELLQPMAVVVLGGLVTSTALTLLLLPALCQWVGPGRRPGVASRTIEPAPATGGARTTGNQGESA